MKLSIRNAGVTLNGNTILESINFDIIDHEHVAIVGRNGTGKTTFLKALIDNELFEEGIDDEKFSITKIGTYSLGYLSQVDFEDENRTLLDEIIKPFQYLIDMENRLNKLVIKILQYEKDYFQIGCTLYQFVEFCFVVQDYALARC